MILKKWFLFASLFIFTFGCRSVRQESFSETATLSQGEASGNLCAALRGNGQRIFAHFGALAAVTEDVGLIKGVGGSSSGTISSFVYESIYMNPDLRKCGSGVCDETTVRSRISLLLKSIEAFLTLGAEIPEVQAVTYFIARLEKLRNSSLVSNSRDEDFEKNLKVIFDPENLGIIDKELLAFVGDDAIPFEYRKATTHEQITTFGKFSAEDPKILYTPGLIDFSAFARLMGKMASFYAGYQDISERGWGRFFENCKNEKDKLWEDFSGQCKEEFSNMVRAFYKGPQGRNRADDLIGANIPAVLSTSVVFDDASFLSFQRGKSAFRDPVKFSSFLASHAGIYDFKNVYFGHWHAPKDGPNLLSAAASKGSSDLQWAKFKSLGQAPWHTALRLSPAEPGLANGQIFEANGKKHISFGGWSNLFPVETLSALSGCDEIAYISRRGNDGRFLYKITSHLGMDESTGDRLYDLKSETSSFRKAVRASDYLMCTDWDWTPLENLDSFKFLVAEGYTTPIRKKGNFGPNVGCN